jgi:hypothetical protein
LSILAQGAGEDKMQPRFERLIRKCRVSALVMGKDNETRLFYLCDRTPECDIAAAVYAGFQNCGLIGYCGGHVLTEPEPGEEAERIMRLARADFILAASVMRQGARSN